MKMRFTLLILLLTLVAGTVMAGEKSIPVDVSASEIAAKSDTPELSKIVDLCATEKEEKFEKEWSKYVAHNDLKDAELQKTIKWVSDEAATQRKKNQHGDGDESDEEAWKAKRQRLMEEYARRAQML
jgi:Skp family chaperone for outer membrane proteins